MLSWFSKFLSSLLVSLLFVTIFGFVLNQTVLNTQYMDSQLQKSNAYSKLSTGITKEVVSSTGDTGVPEATITSGLQAVITPQVVQQRLNTTLTQIQNYYKHGGPVPTLDVSDLVAQAQAAGLPLQPGDLSKPIQLNAVKPARKINDIVRKAQLAAVGSMALLAIAITAIAVKRRNYKPLANVLNSLGWLLMVVGAIGFLLVAQFSSGIKVSATNTDFADVLKSLVNNVGQDIAKRLIIIGAALFVVGIVSRLIIGKLNKSAESEIDSLARQAVPARPIPSVLEGPQARSQPQLAPRPSVEPRRTLAQTPVTPRPAAPQPNPNQPPRPPMVMG